MKPVVQQERTGCGIASVAAIAGLSYAQAKTIANSLGIFASDRRLWSETAHVRALLAHLGATTEPGEQPFRAWRRLPKLALLAIRWHRERGRPFWHWVVFARQGRQSFVLDSKRALRTHRRTDFTRMTPKWYIPVKVRNP